MVSKLYAIILIVIFSLTNLNTIVSQENGEKDENESNESHGKDKSNDVASNENKKDEQSIDNQSTISLIHDEGSADNVSSNEGSTSEVPSTEETSTEMALSKESTSEETSTEMALSKESTSEETSTEMALSKESTSERTSTTESSKTSESELAEPNKINTLSGPSMTEASILPHSTQSTIVVQPMVIKKLPYCRQLETMQKWRYDLILRIDKLRNILVTGGSYPVFLFSSFIVLANELRFLNKMKRFLMSDRWLIYSDSIHANTLIRYETAFSYFGTRIMRGYWNMRLCCWSNLRFSCGSAAVQ